MLQYALRFRDLSVLRFTGGMNITETKVLTDSVQTPPQLQGLGETLFGRVERGRIEQGQPRNSVNLAFNYTREALGINLNNRRFGEVSVFGTAPVDSLINTDQTFGAKWITDLDLSYRLPNGLTLAGGVNNLFDVYPIRTSAGKTTRTTPTQESFVYNGISPFGFNGAFYYIRLSYRLLLNQRQGRNAIRRLAQPCIGLVAITPIRSPSPRKAKFPEDPAPLGHTFPKLCNLQPSPTSTGNAARAASNCHISTFALRGDPAGTWS